MYVVGSDPVFLALRHFLALNMAEYVVSSLLRQDGTVQTTSQFPNFINGNEVQLFVQTHGMVHLRNVQAHSSSHSSSRSLRAMRGQAAR